MRESGGASVVLVNSQGADETSHGFSEWTLGTKFVPEWTAKPKVERHVFEVLKPALAGTVIPGSHLAIAV
jgi:hypothetical protein